MPVAVVLPARLHIVMRDTRKHFQITSQGLTLGELRNNELTEDGFKYDTLGQVSDNYDLRRREGKSHKAWVFIM